MIPSGTYTAFVTKLAEDATRSRAELAKHLEPGDILVTTNAPTHHGGTAWGRLQDRILRMGIRAVYGDAGHAALYVGDGRTVEMSNKLRHWSLKRTVHGKDVHVFRPSAPAEIRSAVAEALVAKATDEGSATKYVGPRTLARALIEDARGHKVYRDSEEPVGEGGRYTCTNVIAKAYRDRGVNLVPKKTVALVTPADFIKSDKTKRVISYFNPRRHDRANRVGIEEHVKSAAEALSSRAELRKKLQPGDIIISSTNKPSKDATVVERIGGQVFSGISRAAYGDNAHASIYVGKGEAVEMFDRLAKVPLSKVISNRDAKVFRPLVERETRAIAARRAREFAAERGETAEYARPAWLLKLLAADTSTLRPLVRGSHDEEMKKNRVICSNTVSAAYKGIVNFRHDKPHGYITPTDLASSPRVEEVATYFNPRRWDPQRRIWKKEP